MRHGHFWWFALLRFLPRILVYFIFIFALFILLLYWVCAGPCAAGRAASRRRQRAHCRATAWRFWCVFGRCILHFCGTATTMEERTHAFSIAFDMALASCGSRRGGRWGTGWRGRKVGRQGRRALLAAVAWADMACRFHMFLFSCSLSLLSLSAHTCLPFTLYTHMHALPLCTCLHSTLKKHPWPAWHEKEEKASTSSPLLHLKSASCSHIFFIFSKNSSTKTP